MITYRALRQDGAGPIAAVLDVRGVAYEGGGLSGDELLRERLTGDTSGAASDTLGEALLGSRDGEGRGGEEHLAEERSSEHDDEQRRRMGVDSNGLSELGVS